jgi:hypothetical protein
MYHALYSLHFLFAVEETQGKLLKKKHMAPAAQHFACI